MKVKGFTIITIILIVIILILTINIESFRYYSIVDNVISNSAGSNGTLILIAAWPNVDVSINETFYYYGFGPAYIMTLNGIKEKLNYSDESLHIRHYIHGRLFSTPGSIFSSWLNISSDSNPINIRTFYNFPESDFNYSYISSKLGDINFFAVFLVNSAQIYIQVVVMPA